MLFLLLQIKYSINILPSEFTCRRSFAECRLGSLARLRLEEFYQGEGSGEEDAMFFNVYKPLGEIGSLHS